MVIRKETRIKERNKGNKGRRERHKQKMQSPKIMSRKPNRVGGKEEAKHLLMSNLQVFPVPASQHKARVHLHQCQHKDTNQLKEKLVKLWHMARKYPMHMKQKFLIMRFQLSFYTTGQCICATWKKCRKEWNQRFMRHPHTRSFA